MRKLVANEDFRLPDGRQASIKFYNKQGSVYTYYDVNVGGRLVEREQIAQHMALPGFGWNHRDIKDAVRCRYDTIS